MTEFWMLRGVWTPVWDFDLLDVVFLFFCFVLFYDLDVWPCERGGGDVFNFG